jgi:hypothetical protein
MSLLPYIICMALTIHGVIKTDGRFIFEDDDDLIIPEEPVGLAMLKRNGPSSSTEKEKAFQSFVEVM